MPLHTLSARIGTAAALHERCALDKTFMLVVLVCPDFDIGSGCQ